MTNESLNNVTDKKYIIIIALFNAMTSYFEVDANCVSGMVVWITCLSKLPNSLLELSMHYDMTDFYHIFTL